MRQLFSLTRFMPGAALLLRYQRAWLLPDLRAGVSVAAVSLPVAIAYSELAGVPPIVGLYSCMLPMLVYAFFGTSRQLIVGPNAATCAVIAAMVVPMSGGDPALHLQLVMIMAAMTGVWCLIASRFKLGVLADFLSGPILMGLLNGVAMTIIVGQGAKILGISFTERYVIERIIALIWSISYTHIPTLIMSMVALIVLLLTRRYKRAWPSSMVAIIITALLTWALDLEQFNIATLGDVGARTTGFQLPNVPLSQLRELILPTVNLAMVSFVSMMLTARSFAAKNGYQIRADKELRALGIANLASALSQGFAISGAGSSTAVNDATGGKSQLVSIVAAGVIALVTFYLTAPLRYIPIATIGIVLIMASKSLLNFKGLWRLWGSDRGAFWLGWITFIAVLFIGVIPGITLAVLLGLFQFLLNVMRPTEQLLGLDKEGVFRTLRDKKQAHAIPGVLIYRFNSPLTYFNAHYFERRVLSLLAQDPHRPKFLIIDAVASFTRQDICVMTMIGGLRRKLQRRGIRIIIAGRYSQLTQWLQQASVKIGEEGVILSPDLHQALKIALDYQKADELQKRDAELSTNGTPIEG